MRTFSDKTGTKVTEDPNKGEYLRLSNELSEDSIPYRRESHTG